MEREKNSRRAHSKEFDCVPPCDLDAERAVLAAVLLEPPRINEVTAVLEPADFTDQCNCTIFEAMLRLQRRGLPADATLLVGELRDGGQYNVQDGVSAAMLVDLFRLSPLACNLPHYMDRVVRISRSRVALGQKH